MGSEAQQPVQEPAVAEAQEPAAAEPRGWRGTVRYWTTCPIRTAPPPLQQRAVSTLKAAKEKAHLDTDTKIQGLAVAASGPPSVAWRVAGYLGKLGDPALQREPPKQILM